VQVIPHITNEIKERIQRVAKNTNPDVVITEIGGTVEILNRCRFGSNSSVPRCGRQNVLYMHVTLGTFDSVGRRNENEAYAAFGEGIAVDWDSTRYLVCRCDRPLSSGLKQKMSEFCDVPVECVITCQDAKSIYEVPLSLEREGLAQQALICNQINANRI